MKSQSHPHQRNVRFDLKNGPISDIAALRFLAIFGLIHRKKILLNHQFGQVNERNVRGLLSAKIRPPALSFLLKAYNRGRRAQCRTIVIPYHHNGVALLFSSEEALAIAGAFSFRAAYRQLEAPAASRC